MDGVELEVTEEAISAIANKAIELKTGARGLRGIFAGMMTDIMYDIPSHPEIKKVIITKDTVENGADPEYVTEQGA